MQSTAFLLTAGLERSGWLENLQPVIERIAIAGIFIPPAPEKTKKSQPFSQRLFLS